MIALSEKVMVGPNFDLIQKEENAFVPRYFAVVDEMRSQG
jgi:hypothetical protein